MADWTRVTDKLPIEGQAVFYYFDVTGVSGGFYNKSDPEYGENVFSGPKGFLTDDVTHWIPREEGDPLPEPPHEPA